MQTSNKSTLVRAADVRREFDNGKVQALRGVSFCVDRGEFIAVVGRSGSGKTCLLQILGALDKPDSGDALFCGESMSKLADPAGFRAKSIGFIFQSFYLLPTLTALENVQVPMFEMSWSSQKRLEQAKKLLAAVGLEHRLDHRPNELSGGERQRVAIARSLANEPELLLADEPTGNLDTETAASILDLLQKIHKERGMTIIVVTHDDEVAARADRVLRIRDGMVVSDKAN